MQKIFKLKPVKKVAIVAVTLFISGICAGVALYEYVVEMTVTQIEEQK